MVSRKKGFVPVSVDVNHYDVMGLDRGSSEAEIKAAWRDLSWTFHPDRFGPEGTDRYASITAAYAVLGDKERREQYHAQLDVASQPCGPCKGAGRTWKQKGFSAKTAARCETCGGTGRTAKKKR